MRNPTAQQAHFSFSRCAARTALMSCACALIANIASAANVYIGNERPGTVSVIDTETDTVVATLPKTGKLGKKIQAVVADPAHKHLFVVDALDGSLVMADLGTGAILQQIVVGKSPEGATMSPSGKTIAVCIEDENLVAFVDVASAKVIKKISTQGKNPEHCVYSSDEHWMLTSNENTDNVDLIDLTAGKSVALIKTSGHPRGIAWLPKKAIAYVTQETAGGVDVIDVAKKGVIDFIHTGSRPADALASKDGTHVYVSNGGDGNIVAIDVKTKQVTGYAKVGKRPWNMALTADGKKLYVANGRSESASVIDTATFTTSKEIAVGGMPWGASIPVLKMPKP